MYQDYTDQRIKYLEIIERVMGRYAHFSAQVKNAIMVILWTAIIGLLGVFASIWAGIRSSDIFSQNFVFTVYTINNTMLLSILSIFAATILGCWSLDAIYYYKREKLYGEFYDMVRSQPSNKKPDFCIDIPSYITKRESNWGIVLWSSTSLFYVVMLGYFSLLLLLTYYGFILARFAVIAAKQEGSPTSNTKSDTPSPKTDTPSPKTDTPSPTSDTPSPESDTPSPESDTPSPKSDTPSPKSDTPSPESDTPLPKSDTPSPNIDSIDSVSSLLLTF